MSATPSGEEPTRDSRRWLLPIAGTGVVVLGSFLWVRVSTEFGQYLSLVLVLMGLATIVGSIAARGRRDTTHPTSAGPSGPSGGTGPVRPIGTGTGGRNRAPVSGVGRIAASAVAHVGDKFWLRWLAPRASALGASATGRIRGTAYASPPAGPVAALPGRGRDILFVQPPDANLDSAGNGRGLPRGPTASRSPAPGFPLSSVGNVVAGISAVRPFSEDELDRLFPPGTNSHVAVGPARDGGTPHAIAVARRPDPSYSLSPPAAPVDPRWVNETSRVLESFSAGDFDYLHGGFTRSMQEFDSAFPRTFGGGPTLDSSDHQIYLEAINPVPPHLRPVPAVLTRTVETRSCAVCSKRLADFRSWADCPGCRAPICWLCLRLSFLTEANGYCSGCKEGRAQPAG